MGGRSLSKWHRAACTQCECECASTVSVCVCLSERGREVDFFLYTLDVYV